ncbi:MAG: RNA polymerase sigma factor [Bacteroidia bacterium]
MQFNEKEIIEGCLRGDASAQSKLYHKFAPKMLGVCYRYMQTIYEAEDVLQEAFIKVFKHIETFQNNNSIEFWIRRIVVNTALNHIKQNKKFKEESDVDNVEDEGYTDEVHMKFDTEEVINAIKSLPEGYRAIFNLYAIEGFSHKEIAEQLGIAEATSRSQYFRAKTILQNKLSIIYKRDEQALAFR